MTVGMMTRTDGTGYATLEAIEKSAEPFVLEYAGARWPIRGLLVDHLGPLGRPVPFALELGKRIAPPAPAVPDPDRAIDAATRAARVWAAGAFADDLHEAMLGLFLALFGEPPATIAREDGSR